MTLLEKLAKIEGFNSVDAMIQASILDSVSPGICVTCGEYTTEVEPDCREGWCEECESGCGG